MEIKHWDSLFTYIIGRRNDLNDRLTRIIYKYARENLALVNIYIKDPAVTRVKRDQKVPLIWFVANIGGILGLTMGMSLVTIFEIIHHVAIVFFRTGQKSLETVRRTMTSSSSFQLSRRYTHHHHHSASQGDGVDAIGGQIMLAGSNSDLAAATSISATSHQTVLGGPRSPAQQNIGLEMASEQQRRDLDRSLSDRGCNRNRDPATASNGNVAKKLARRFKSGGGSSSDELNSLTIYVPTTNATNANSNATRKLSPPSSSSPPDEIRGGGQFLAVDNNAMDFITS